LEQKMNMVDVSVNRFNSHGSKYGSSDIVGDQLIAEKQVKSWENAAFLKLYTSNFVYNALNLELRRFSYSFKKEAGHKLSEYEETELSSCCWDPKSSLEELWLPYILGCLSNYTTDKRLAVGSGLNLTLRRGYIIPIDKLQNYAENFKVGKIFYWPGFTSTSNNIKGFRGTVQVTIKPARRSAGIDISSISHHSDEREVLFPPFTWFIVRSQNLSSCLELEIDEYPLADYLERIVIVQQRIRDWEIALLASIQQTHRTAAGNSDTSI